MLELLDINNRVCLQFDKTFGLTGYYVSTLNFLHPCLVNNNTQSSPAIPLSYFIHEKKFEKTHNEFWSYIFDVLPELNDVAFYVTDCERGFRNAIKKYFPDAPLLRCWKHLWASIERWVRKHGGKAEDVGFYCDGIREILLQPTEQHYIESINNKKKGYISNFKFILNFNYLFIFYIRLSCEQWCPDAKMECCFC